MLKFKNRVIAVCCAAIDSDYTEHYMNYFVEFSKNIILKFYFSVLLVIFTAQEVAVNMMKAKVIFLTL